MIKILANDGLDPAAVLQLEAAGCELHTEKVPQEGLPMVLPAYDAVIVRSATKIRQDLIDACPKLKVIARAGVGLDNIDHEYARSKGISVMNTPAASSRSVAELVFAHLLGLSRMLPLANREMPSKGHTHFKELKKQCKGQEIAGRTMGIIGFGRIGQEVARMALGLGMKVLPVDPLLPHADLKLEVHGLAPITLRLATVEMEEMLKQADFLTIHVPFSGGKPIIGRAELDRMKPSAMLVNTSRGGAVDEQALLNALNSDHLAGAALDVYEGEPTPKEALLAHPLIACSPHIGASTAEASAKIGLELAEQLLAFFK